MGLRRWRTAHHLGGTTPPQRCRGRGSLRRAPARRAAALPPGGLALAPRPDSKRRIVDCPWHVPPEITTHRRTICKLMARYHRQVVESIAAEGSGGQALSRATRSPLSHRDLTRGGICSEAAPAWWGRGHAEPRALFPNPAGRVHPRPRGAPAGAGRGDLPRPQDARAGAGRTRTGGCAPPPRWSGGCWRWSSPTDSTGCSGRGRCDGGRRRGSGPAPPAGGSVCVGCGPSSSDPLQPSRRSRSPSVAAPAAPRSGGRCESAMA